MKKHEFADYYTEKIPRDSQKKMVGNHINWWNYEKISKMLTGAGFRKVYRSTPGGSHFTEMKAGGKNGFDYTRPEISLFVEAVRE